MHEHELDGCRPVPLAHYLKAIGVLRLVAEQIDPSVRGCWRNERFVLCSRLSRDALVHYFLNDYRPTPIVAPWNGGSGFYPKDNRSALDALVASNAPRFAEYRETIGLTMALFQELGIAEKTSGESKTTLLQRCRATFPDHSLRWLDSTYVLSTDGAKYPPLLGTGGNDGRLDFTNNFMQRLLCLVDASTGQSMSESKGLLEAALFGELTSGMLKGAPIGQFLPGHAGGANASSGFDADSLINPWDYVLMLEGATAFAAATVRRMEQDMGALSYPFTVRSIGAGYASAAKQDESSSRAEIWLPLWSRPAAAPEIQSLFSEGRARVERRPAQNGVDFARAVASLGVDRGIEAFQRYGFQERNGLAYFAIPLGRFAVRCEERAARVQEIDSWLEGFRWRANSQNAPESVRRALRQLDTAIFDLCTRGDALRLQHVLIALGECERVMASSPRWVEESRAQPVPALSTDWVRSTNDGSIEWRLAASLASVRGRFGSSFAEGKVVPFRTQLEPVSTWKLDSGLQVRWNSDAGREVVWTAGHLVNAMNAVMHRRLLTAVQHGAATYPDRGSLPSSLEDIADFIEQRVDDERFASLLWGFILLDWTRDVPYIQRPAEKRATPDAFYALLKLCFAGAPGRFRTEGLSRDVFDQTEPVDVPIDVSIHRAAASGHGSEASRRAIRRLRGSGLVPAVSTFELRGNTVTRTAAALLFPISTRDRKRLKDWITRPSESRADTDEEVTTQPTGATQ
jgi:CRISPR-associated protein Csx17